MHPAFLLLYFHICYTQQVPTTWVAMAIHFISKGEWQMETADDDHRIVASSKVSSLIPSCHIWILQQDQTTFIGVKGKVL